MSDLRPCMVGEKRALFHGWAQIRKCIDASPLIGGHPGGFIEGPLAIVEYESGCIEMESPSAVTFLDSGQLFRSYAFVGVASKGEHDEGCMSSYPNCICLKCANDSRADSSDGACCIRHVGHYCPDDSKTPQHCPDFRKE